MAAPALQTKKITPEMIEAGAREIWNRFCDVLSYGSETGRATATAVFRAMEKARRHRRDSTPNANWRRNKKGAKGGRRTS